jgi:hypothetical protein
MRARVGFALQHDDLSGSMPGRSTPDNSAWIKALLCPFAFLPGLAARVGYMSRVGTLRWLLLLGAVTFVTLTFGAYVIQQQLRYCKDTALIVEESRTRRTALIVDEQITESSTRKSL